jgi:predicted AlkP superfamily phosphohydrolase/phosphomutase
MPAVRRRFLVLGLDGGSFDLLDPLMEAGELPFLRSLVHRGVRAPLRSVYPAKTIPAWYSFATGKDPGELGIFGFTEPDGLPGHSRLVQTFRPAEAVWDRLSRLGVKVGVVNFPMRSAYPLHGFVVPGMFTSDPQTYPRSVRSDIQATLGERYPPELPAYRDSERKEWIQEATRSVEKRGEAAAALAEQHRPDFLFALFRETDRIEHEFWSELDRPVGQIAPELLQFWRSVDAACGRVDRAFRSPGGPAVTLAISDHGHGGIRSEFLTNRWLAENKFLVFRENAALARRRFVSRMMLYAQRVGVTRRLSRRISSFVRDGRRAVLANYLSGKTSFEDVCPQIDWERTVAFSYPVPEGIYLNPQNPGLTATRRTEILEEIRRRLEAFPEAHIEVFGPGEIYRGHRLDQGPSLFIRVNGMAAEPRMDFSYPQSFLRDRPEYFYGTGTHRMEGILLGAGDGVEPGGELPSLSLLDVTPTILEGMGASGFGEMVGHSFLDDLAETA